MSQIYAHLAALEAARRPFVLATVIDTGGSSPGLVGAQMAIEPDTCWGTVGGGALELEVQRKSRALLADPDRNTDRLDVHLVRDLAMCCGGRMDVFMQKVTPEPQAWIFGAGHVGTELAWLADRAGFKVVVVDSRDAWADPSRFPDTVDVRDADPEDLVRAEPPQPWDYVVVVTYDHALDEAILRELAPHPVSYLGLVGSRGKWARFQKRFRAREMPEPAITRVRCPVGLDIHAETPAEIAVSVVAEMVAHRRQPPA